MARFFGKDEVRHRVFDIVVPRGDYLSEKLVSAFEAGSYERWEGEFVRKILKGGERVLELGGGIGFVSTLACKAATPQIYHVIEANPALIPVIADVHRRNGVADTPGLKVDNCILTNTPADLAKGSVTFAVAYNFTASSAMKTGIGRPEIEVPARSFNDEVAKHRYDTLICDIEGSELALFRTADLTHFQTLMIEVHKSIIGLQGVQKVFARIGRAGFGYDEDLSHGSVVTFRRFE